LQAPSKWKIRVEIATTGLLDSTLIVWGGEFGRMPLSEGNRNTIYRCVHPTFLSPFAHVRAKTIRGATRMMDYSSIYSQLFGLSLGSLQMAFVICIFLALIFKPERIVRPLMFRIACLLFVLTLLTPILQVVITTMTGPPGDLGRPAAGTISGYLMALINPAVFSAAFLSAVGSMMGKQPVQSAD